MDPLTESISIMVVIVVGMLFLSGDISLFTTLACLFVVGVWAFYMSRDIPPNSGAPR